jgi:hypothetical protein
VEASGKQNKTTKVVKVRQGRKREREEGNKKEY